MPMNPPVLNTAARAAAFNALQSAFLGDVPPEYQALVTEQHDKIATAVAAAVIEVISHITQFAQATGVVSTAVNTSVITAGTAAAQSGTGTGSGSGTATVAPGGIT